VDLFASIGKWLLVDHPRAHNSFLSLKQGDEKRVGGKKKKNDNNNRRL
jgi:hypothetical protein